MRDEPSAALFLKADDDFFRLGRIKMLVGNSCKRFEAFAVVHRGQETFTHIYLVACYPTKARTEVRLVAVFAGEAVSAARIWATDHLDVEVSDASEWTLSNAA